jgi:glycosyltransferase involved in cell wall biosynthesis
MLVSCIFVSHNKPHLCHEAIQSVVNQTHQEWECLVVDSGVLYDQGYYDSFSWSSDERLIFIRSTETDSTRRTKAMAPWCFNECFRNGAVKGDLVMYLCDDDLLYPNAFQTFVSYSESRPDVMAMYASQDIGMIYSNGWRAVTGERRAVGVAGRCVNGRTLDCQVDYLQFCHRLGLLNKFPSDEYWPEGKDTESHADGVFMERCGLYVPVHPIDIKVSQNRRTPQSTYVPSN